MVGPSATRRHRLSTGGRPTNLRSALTRRIAADIVAGKLAPASRLPTEHALMQAHGVSRTVVREAIAALRAEGLVETRRGSGAYVAPDPRKRPFRIDPDGLESVAEVLDVLELRISVEVEAAGLAAQRRREAHMERLARIGQAFAEAIERGDNAVDLDYDFHAAIGAATGNPYFLSFLEFIGRIIIPRRSILFDEGDVAGLAPYLTRIRHEHDLIAEAIANADVASARRAMRSHLTGSRDRYRQLVGDG